MNLQQAKDQVSKDYLWNHFQEIIDDHRYEIALKITNEAAELYAQSQVNDALDKAISIVSKHQDESTDNAEYLGHLKVIEELKRLKR